MPTKLPVVKLPTAKLPTSYRILKKDKAKIGLDPGALVLVGRQKVAEAEITVIQFNAESLKTETVQTFSELTLFPKPGWLTWVTVTGLHDIPLMHALGERFQLAPLMLEDILDTNHRPDLTLLDDTLYCLLKLIHWQEFDAHFVSDQVSIVLKENLVLTFLEKPEPVILSIQERVIHAAWRAKNRGADYLTYTILDGIVDHYFSVLEHKGLLIDEMEANIPMSPESHWLKQVNVLKQELLVFKKQVWPLREVMGMFQQLDTPLIQESTKPYFQDVHDHVVQTIEVLETFRDVIHGVSEMHLSLMSYRMNQIMQQLTVVTTIFIPLTFIVGVYGMNFEHMPELTWKWGYFGVMAFMALVALGLLIYFKRKKLI